MTQETTRPTHELYIELCRMSGRGLTGTPEYRELNAEYQTAVDRAIGRVATIREVIIEAVDIWPAGDEPYVGWSLVLAERIANALEKEGTDA